MSSRAALVALLALGGVSAAGCTTPAGGSATGDGCRPATTIWLPGVNGLPGRPMMIPGSCPAAATLAGAEPAAPPTPRPVPADLPSARAAIENGVAQLCSAFLVEGDTSLPAMQARAFTAGYARGSSVQAVPLPDMLAQPAFTMLGFQARIAGAAPNSGVAAFVGNYHDPVCQLQVYDFAAEAAAFVSSLEAAGWRKVGAETRSENIVATRFHGQLSGKPVTLVVNRWAGEAAPGGLGYIINVVLGEEFKRGVLE